MALQVVTMVELRIQLLEEAVRTGDTVTEVCRRWGISRQTFYEYQRRYVAECEAGLERPLNALIPQLQARFKACGKDGAERVIANFNERRHGTPPRGGI